MHKDIKYFLVMSLFCLCFAVFLENAYSQSRPKPSKRKAIKAAKQAAKNKYKYVSSHDLNGDGKIDAKDRLIWLKNNKGNLPKVLVSEENEGLIESMDVDGDGDVEDWEMQGFYSNYDLNQNGVLEEDEIEAASE